MSMHRIRRAERLMSLSASWNLVKDSDVIRLGLIDNDLPYIVPLNYILKGDTIYFHSAKEGRKIDILLRGSNKVCLEVDKMIDIKHSDQACKFSCYYESVIAYGDVVFISDEKEKADILNDLVRKYAKTGFSEVPHNKVDNIEVIGVKITDISGKHLLPENS